MSSIIIRPGQPIPDYESAFDSLVEQTLKTVTASSARVYRQTYDLWADFCSNHQHDPLDLRPAAVLAFAEAQRVTRATRKRQMSAMRKLAKMLWILSGDDDAGRIYAALKETRPPETNLRDNARDRRALSPDEVRTLLNVWHEDNPLHRRNRAIIALLFLTGLRRSELAALRWDDLDLESCTLRVRAGKGDREREVTIAGRLAIHALRRWREALPGRMYVFPSFNRARQPSADSPTDGQTVFRVVKRTEALSGIQFSPHTARRTFITEGLLRGASLASMQAQAGHIRGETTLGYARPLDARQRRHEFRHRYDEDEA